MDILNVNQITFMGVNLALIGTVALMLIMVTMGLTLDLNQFRRSFKQPKAIVVGLVAQLVLLPTVAFILVTLFEPALPVAIGLIILACCPSGATSNFFTHLARGSVATSICLTTLSGLVVIFTIPLIINFALDKLLEDEQQRIFLPVIPSMLRIFVLIVLPVIVGMVFRYLWPRLSALIEPWATRFSFVTILFTMALVLKHVAPVLPELIIEAGAITLLLNATMMGVGFAVALWLRLEEKNARCICIEIGVQNYILSVVIAIDMLNNPTFAIAPIIYLFVMYITVFSFIGYCRFFRDRSSALTPGSTG
ncbi:bile acid:sodium symporter family protein [Porticoccus sp. GXU_MW_L64]